MKHILLLLSFLTIPALARTPPLSPEQTVRQIYHSYEIESDSSILVIQRKNRLFPRG